MMVLYDACGVTDDLTIEDIQKALRMAGARKVGSRVSFALNGPRIIVTFKAKDDLEADRIGLNAHKILAPEREAIRVLAQAHNFNLSETLIALAKEVQPITEAELAAQQESYVLSEMAMGSDRDEANYRAALFSGDKVQLRKLDQDSENRVKEAFR